MAGRGRQELRDLAATVRFRQFDPAASVAGRKGQSSCSPHCRIPGLATAETDTRLLSISDPRRSTNSTFVVHGSLSAGRR